MSRLRYSVSAYLRKMQMSTTSLFLFIEGYRDRYVYSRIMHNFITENNISYVLITAEEIDLNLQGKEGLKIFIKYLKKRGAFIDQFKGKTSISFFLLDKDVEDFLNMKYRSRHVIYTDHYEIENYLFIYGDLADAAARSACLDVNNVRDIIGDNKVWRKKAAECWRDWTKLCLYAKTHRLNSISNYSQNKSLINEGIYGPIKPDLYSTYLNDIRKKTGFRAVAFKRSFNRLSKKIDRLYSEDKFDSIFKGKWYTEFLIDDIKIIAGRRRINKRALSEKILSNLAQNAHAKDCWTDVFISPIREILNENELIETKNK